jgi:hypothetical protein
MCSRTADAESSVLPGRVEQKAEQGQRLQVTSVVVRPLHHRHLEEWSE